MLSAMSSDISPNVIGSIEKRKHIPGTNFFFIYLFVMSLHTCFSMEPFTLGNMSLDIALDMSSDMCPSVKALVISKRPKGSTGDQCGP